MEGIEGRVGDLVHAAHMLADTLLAATGTVPHEFGIIIDPSTRRPMYPGAALRQGVGSSPTDRQTVERAAKAFRRFARSLTADPARPGDDVPLRRAYSPLIGSLEKTFRDTHNVLVMRRSAFADEVECQWETLISTVEELDRLIMEQIGPREDPAAQGAFEAMVEAERQREAEKSDGPATEAGTGPEEAGEPPQLSAEAKAIALLYPHPEWTDVRIAQEAGCARTTLYKYPKYVAARKMLKQSGRSSMPHGSKDAETGGLEAWDE